MFSHGRLTDADFSGNPTLRVPLAVEANDQGVPGYHHPLRLRVFTHVLVFPVDVFVLLPLVLHAPFVEVHEHPFNLLSHSIESG
jgi:hypothetical protein